MIKRIPFIALLTALAACASLPAAAQSGRTFYIDYASGSNSNNGTSKNTPWKTHPYMQAASACTGSGSAPSYSHAAGDQFIFKGGVAWPFQCFGLVVGTAGVSGAPDYYGVDLSWFNGASWTRPIFDMSGHSVPVQEFGNHMVIFCSANPCYITIDNVEIKNQLITAGSLYCQDGAIYTVGQVSTVKNVHVHGWRNAGAFDLPSGGICNAGVVDGALIHDDDSGFTPMGGCFVDNIEVKNSECHHVPHGWNGGSKIHDSRFHHLGADPQGIHEQVIQNLWGPGAAIYNNVVHDSIVYTITGCPGDAIYNNVVWAAGNQAQIEIEVGGNCGVHDWSTYAMNVYNNTIGDCLGGVCIRPIFKGQGTLGTLNIYNNHFINSVSLPYCINNLPQNCANVNTVNYSNNVLMTTTAATSQGYSVANEYASSSGSAGTVQAGTNLSGRCSGLFAALCADRLGVPRPSKWDAGAYQFDSGSASRPNPPANLTAIIN
jgi:hypothetical protein